MLRIVNAVAPNGLELGIDVEGPGGSDKAVVLVFLSGHSRELGVYRKLPDGGEDYVSDYLGLSIPQSTKPIATTLHVETSPPRATLSWPGETPIVFALSGRLPTSITKVSLLIGAKRVAAEGGALDVRFDDVYCDVD